MRQTIPEQKLIFCDNCHNQINEVDLHVHLQIADRDFSGSIVYGHSEDYDYCQTCAGAIYNKIKGI